MDSFRIIDIFMAKDVSENIWPKIPQWPSPDLQLVSVFRSFAISIIHECSLKHFKTKAVHRNII